MPGIDRAPKGARGCVATQTSDRRGESGEDFEDWNVPEATVLRSSSLSFDLSFRARRRVEPLQASNDFFGGQFAASFPTIQISMSDDVVHGKNALGDTFVVDDGQAPDLFFRHSAHCFVNLVVRLAGEDVGCGDLPYCYVTGQAVARAHGDTDVAVGHNPDEFAVFTDDREHAAVVGPEKLDCDADIGVGFAGKSRWRHYVSNLHGSMLRRRFRAPHDLRS